MKKYEIINSKTGAAMQQNIAYSTATATVLNLAELLAVESLAIKFDRAPEHPSTEFLSSCGGLEVTIRLMGTKSVGRPKTGEVRSAEANRKNPLRFLGKAADDGWYGHKVATIHDAELDPEQVAAAAAREKTGVKEGDFLLWYTDATNSHTGHAFITKQSQLKTLTNMRTGARKSVTIDTSALAKTEAKKRVEQEAPAGTLAAWLFIYRGGDSWQLIYKRYVNLENS